MARVEEVSGEMTPVTGIEGCTLTGDEGSADYKANILDEYRDAIVKLLEENKDLFAKNDLDLGRTNTLTCKIDTGTYPPITLKPYRMPLNQRPVVEKAVDEMLEAGVIQPSTSNWSFPILLVPKPNGTKRFSVDFRKLNQITKRYAYPLPLIDEVLAGLGNSKFFTSLDLKSGYWQVSMDEMDREKMSYVCHKGLFSFNMMLMGITNGLGFFQELMTHVLEGINGKFAVAYLDGIVIYSPTANDHLRHLTEVFARLRKHGLQMKMSKCEFMQSQIKYL